jgi:hypothetical protein
MISVTEFPDEEIEPVGFDLANGSKVSISLGYFWSKVDDYIFTDQSDREMR